MICVIIVHLLVTVQNKERLISIEAALECERSLKNNRVGLLVSVTSLRYPVFNMIYMSTLLSPSLTSTHLSNKVIHIM